MSRQLYIPLLVLGMLTGGATLLALPQAAQALDPPHDPSNLPQVCATCHITHGSFGALLNPAVGDTINNLCASCHYPGGPAQDVDTHQCDSAADIACRNTFTMSCTACHDPHLQDQPKYGSTYGKFIKDPLLTPTGEWRQVKLLGPTGPGSFADGDTTIDGICEVCHTQTTHHKNSGPRGDHNPGTNCIDCHSHAPTDTAWGFAPVPHPAATSDCAACHRDPATGTADLPWIHGGECTLCHTTGFDGTFLGPKGTWNGQCSQCHAPGVAETGNAATPTKSHRCVVCHGSQITYANKRDLHIDHAERVNCVVCHGFIPDMDVQIGSGNRDVCALCHSPSFTAGTASTTFHKKHASKSLSCLECHAGSRPPVDVVSGAPVGGAANVCEVCHTDESPAGFGSSRHKKHTKQAIDCGACHASANLQDDRSPMPPLDDVVRQGLSRAAYGECKHCHGKKGMMGGPWGVHQRHVEGMAQWCYNCHTGDDTRPTGQSGPVTAPSEACGLCHSNKTYSDATPFEVHLNHAGKKADVKCYACHQATPPLFGWPLSWL